MDMDVSVYCLTYNQFEYIEKTILGFINQNTHYSYEVIIHDDASTDGTQEIIKKYAALYPDIIKPIFQSENQNSKKISIYQEFILPQIKGKYIAVCEGDDYWCDDDKLEKQVAYMEEHPECSLCVGNTRTITEDGKDKKYCINLSKKEMDYSADDVIAAGGSGLFHTSTFLYRKESRDKKPANFRITGIGDYPLAIYLSTIGYVHYFPQIMSKYRIASKGSWTNRLTSSKEKYIELKKIHIEDLKKLDEITNFQYTDSFTIAENRLNYYILLKQKRILKLLFQKEYSSFLFERGFLNGIKVIIRCIIKG